MEHRYESPFDKGIGGAIGFPGKVPHPGAGVRRRRRRHNITIIVPVLNEEPILDALVEELLSALEARDFSWKVLFVDDGSSDGSLGRLREIHAADTRFTLISLSRNFGKESAITAGLHHASGDAVIIMDGDLQHPPSVIPKLVERWREGYKVVFAQRDTRAYESFLRRLSAHVFYAIFRRLGGMQLPTESGDFVLLDRKAVDAINEIGERARFLKHCMAGSASPRREFRSAPGSGRSAVLGGTFLNLPGSRSMV